jgi:hypothetical protein
MKADIHPDYQETDIVARAARFITLARPNETLEPASAPPAIRFSLASKNSSTPPGAWKVRPPLRQHRRSSGKA